MPLYIYKHPETGEVKEILQGMNDEHSYEEGGVKWQRVWTKPQASFDTRLDPYSKKQFVEKTKNIKKWSEAWDISKEMSQAREEKEGRPDPVKKKAEESFYYKNNRIPVKKNENKRLSED